MILLDTHIWVWWMTASTQLTARHQHLLNVHQSSGLGVSIISCWEVAKLVEIGRIGFTLPVLDWLQQAIAHPALKLLDLNPEIAVASTQLPPPFHRDPADQIIVASARHYGLPLLTADTRILAYPHVTVLR